MGLSYVASSVGQPLFADEATEKGKLLSFAKICVEVDASSSLPDSTQLQYPNGDAVTIGIKYPWKPLKCSKCMAFGHMDVACSVVEGVQGQNMELQLPETEELEHLGCVTSMLPKISTPVGQGIVAFADKANGKAGRVSPSPNSPRLSTSRRQLCPDIEASLVMTSGKVGMPKPASPSSVGLKLPAPNSKPADPTASKVGYSLAGTGNNFFEGDTNNVLGVNKLSLLRETSSLVEVSIPADDAEELDVLEGTMGPPSSSKLPN